MKAYLVKARDTAVGVIVTAILGGAYMYFSNWAPKSHAQSNTKKIKEVKTSVVNLGATFDGKIKAQNDLIAMQAVKIESVNNKVDRVLVGLCIINAKTCSLKKRPD